MTTRWIVSFQAVDPNNPDGFWEVGVPPWLYKVHQNKGKESALSRLLLVGEVLQGGTIQLRRGWSRPGKDEDCYAYIGKPKRDYPSAQIDLPAPPGKVFVVFVLKDGAIDEWTWRNEVEDKGEFVNPDGVKGELIWPLNKKFGNF
jgi:hypothetical protein